MIDDKRMRQAAKKYLTEYQMSVFPLLPNDKRPQSEWNARREVLASVEDVDTWTGCNLALATGKLSRVVVIDCESKQDAEWFYGSRGQTEVIVQTRRGFHLFFRYPEFDVGNGAKVKDDDGKPRYDIRGEGGYVVCPPSVIQGWTYQFVFGKSLRPADELPLFREEWLPQHHVNSATWPAKKYTDAVAYIERIRAVSGQGGHNDTWRAVNVLKDSGMDSTEALATLVEWNRTNAEPAWSMGELLHKVKDCYGKGQ